MAVFYTTTHEHLAHHEQASHARWAFRTGALGGVVAGIVFAVFEMIGATITADAPLNPLRMIASVPLGLPPIAIPTATAVLVGGLFHLIYSAALGVIAAGLIARFRALHTSRSEIVVITAIFGFLVWLVNFYIIAPLIGRPWFVNTNPIAQFIWHTFAFGAVLGWFLDSRPPRHAVKG